LNLKYRYSRISNEINKYDRDIVFALCSWGNGVEFFGYELASSWRTTADIQDNYDKMIWNFLMNANTHFIHHGKQYGWNDPDILEIGNGGMNITEYKTHFQLWCIVKAPLILGNDVSKINLNDDIYNIISNKNLININQDPLGITAICVR